MLGFWARIATVNGREVALHLARLAELIVKLTPGSPQFAYPVLFITTQGDISMGEITVKDSDAGATGTVSFVDAKGAATQPDDVPAWSSSDEAVCTVTAEPDGLTATLAYGTPGAAVIEVKSTDTDGTEIVAQGTVTVQPGEATIGSVDFKA